MTRRRGKKVLVAMSGGVDSSVAAALLLEQGYDVVGCFMRLGGADEPAEGFAPAEAAGACGRPASARRNLAVGGRRASEDASPAPDAERTRHVSDDASPAPDVAPVAGRAGHQGCCSVNDAADARLVAAMLDIPFYVLNFKRDFGRIIDYFVAEYNAGRTPNPCVRCNDWLKFGKLWSYAQSIDADYVATGHYARVEHGSGGARLLRGLDPRKDQSYVLFGTRREMLGHMLLPIGDLAKPQVRRIAQRCGLPVFDKPDSQEICFVPDNDYAGLVKRRTPLAVGQGDVLDRDGRVVGRHGGHQHFTIGQRRGVGVALGYPIYVVERDAAANTVTVGTRDDLLAGGLEAGEANWLVEPPAGAPRPCGIKVRYNGPPVAGTVRATGPDTLEVRFAQPQAAITPGQAAVCYDGEELLGGGWITRSVN